MTWPHELVYTATDQPVVYEELSVTLFVSGYLAIMETVKPIMKQIMGKHLKELMTDAEVYRWAPVRVYHVVWLHHIEHGQAKCSDVDTKLKFCRALVWQAAPLAQ